MNVRVLSLAVCIALSAGVACRNAAKEPSPGTSSRSPAVANPEAVALLQGFAAAIVERDYAKAYAAVATERRSTLSQQDLEEAFRHYRDGLPDGLKTEVKVDPYDGDSPLVPEELRERIVAEGVVHFTPEGDAEGFNAIVWILMEAGVPRLASFYVED